MSTRFSLSFGALVMLASSDAFAYKCSRIGNDGPSLTWQMRAIPWLVNARLSDDLERAVVLEDLQASFAAWENIDCSDLTLPFLGERSGVTAGFNDDGQNNNNVVIFIESAWPHDNGVIALTNNAFDSRTGALIDSDIEMNGVEFKFARVDTLLSCPPGGNTMDLRNTLTHEVGHLLGLDHPPQTRRNEESTMYPSAPPCETKKASLAQDDIDGICAIYPTGMSAQQCFPPDGPKFLVVETDDGYGCSTTQANLDPLLLLGAALLIRSRKPKRIKTV